MGNGTSRRWSRRYLLRQIRHQARRYIVPIGAVVILAVVAMFSLGPGSKILFSPAAQHSTAVVCDSDHSSDRDSSDQGNDGKGCPPCHPSGYTGNCDGDNDSDDNR